MIRFLLLALLFLPSLALSQSVMTDEIREFHEAALAARDYAENNYGVGILIHVGPDSFPNQHFATADDFGAVIVSAFQSQHNVDARYFLRHNDVGATGMRFYIDDLIHGADDGTEDKNLAEALEAMTSVVEQLRVAKAR